MEEVFREIIDSGILRYAIDLYLAEDDVYAKDLKDAEQLYECIRKLLSEDNQMVLDDYKSIVRSADSRAQEIAFLAGVQCTIEYLQQTDAIKTP